MKSINLKSSLIILLVSVISLSSCNSSDELSAGITSNLVTVDNEGTTLILFSSLFFNHFTFA